MHVLTDALPARIQMDAHVKNTSLLVIEQVCKETYGSTFLYNFNPSPSHKRICMGNVYNILKYNISKT